MIQQRDINRKRQGKKSKTKKMRGRKVILFVCLFVGLVGCLVVWV